MEKAAVARAVLVVDGGGCLAAAAALMADRRVGDLVHPSQAWRLPVGLALGATSTILLGSAARQSPTQSAMRCAALVNAGWVAACVAALSRPLPTSGRVLVGTTFALDAAVGTAQWALSR
ncbi:hypothetical protein [Gordonia phthalatica]|uniref:hypothetical protein n=1 Tax=Gordonia phthalatica TaxID=1136941 RepID=UPI00078665F4|nr:hypothetical protein [Gordonia phthalatica]